MAMQAQGGLGRRCLYGQPVLPAKYGEKRRIGETALVHNVGGRGERDEYRGGVIAEEEQLCLLVHVFLLVTRPDVVAEGG